LFHDIHRIEVASKETEKSVDTAVNKRKGTGMTTIPTSSSHIAPAASAQPLQTRLETQVSMLKELAGQQERISQLLTDSDRGQAIDVFV
jgi:hypothetical protein